MKSPQLKTPEEWADNSLMNSDGQGLDYYGIIGLVESVREEFSQELIKKIQKHSHVIPLGGYSKARAGGQASVSMIDTTMAIWLIEGKDDK